MNSFQGSRRCRSALGLAAFALQLLASTAATAASFDCQQAQQPDERAICASRQLSEMDVEMAVRFEMLMGLVPMGTRGHMGDEQQDWLVARNKCGSNQPCLVAAYRDRIAVLKDEYARLQSRGPF